MLTVFTGSSTSPRPSIRRVRFPQHNVVDSDIVEIRVRIAADYTINVL